MALAKNSLHKKKFMLKQELEDNPNDEKLAKKLNKVRGRIKAGDDRPNETLQQRFKRVKGKAKTMGRTEQRAERLAEMKERIKNPTPTDIKVKQPRQAPVPTAELDKRKKKGGPADKPKMKRPPSTKVFAY